MPIAMPAVLAALALLPACAPAKDTYTRSLPIAPRLQWNSNFGYCGETSFISAGMHFGQYTSQWTARRLASPGVPEWRRRSQLLVGVNDRAAARRMRLRAQEFGTPHRRGPKEMLAWLKAEVIAGHVPIIGVFNNVTRLGESGAGDPVYDHIVPVLGVDSQQPLTPGAGYRPTDSLTISDNGLYGKRRSRPFLFTYRFRSFPRTRQEANAPHGPLYSLRPRAPDYGISVSGVRDPQRVTAPVRLTSDAHGEGVENRSWLGHPPRPFRIRLTAHARLPDPNAPYDVYLYRSFGDVPARNFNAHAGDAIRHWHIPAGHGEQWTKTIAARSDQTRVFRAVPSSAP